MEIPRSEYSTQYKKTKTVCSGKTETKWQLAFICLLWALCRTGTTTLYRRVCVFAGDNVWRQGRQGLKVLATWTTWKSEVPSNSRDIAQRAPIKLQPHCPSDYKDAGLHTGGARTPTTTNRITNGWKARASMRLDSVYPITLTMTVFSELCENTKHFGLEIWNNNIPTHDMGIRKIILFCSFATKMEGQLVNCFLFLMSG